MNRLLSSILLLSLISIVYSSNCYENWSRCTPATSFGTGILWKGCADYCRQCKGYSGGSCKKVQNKVCSGGYQCQCSGSRIKPSDNLLVKTTCALGL